MTITVIFVNIYCETILLWNLYISKSVKNLYLQSSICEKMSYSSNNLQNNTLKVYRYLRVPQNTYFQKFNNNFLLRSIRYRTQHFLFWFDFCLLISSLKALDTMCSEIERQKLNFCNAEVNYRLTRAMTSIKFQSTMRLIW